MAITEDMKVWYEDDETQQRDHKNKQTTMDIKRILKFLKDLSANNNRPWFNEHKDEYTAVRADFEDGVAKAIARIATFDPSVAHITVKDSTYRSIATRVSRPTSRPTSVISEPISPPTARRLCTADITSISNRDTALCRAATIGCPPTSSLRAATRLWVT